MSFDIDISVDEFDPRAEPLPEVLAAILDYWDRVRSEKFAPSIAEFQLAELPPNLVPSCVIIDLHQPDEFDPQKAVFRFFGSNWRDTIHKELTGKSIDQFSPSSAANSISNQYARTVELRRPVAFRNLFPTPQGTVAKFTILRLPLSSDAKRIDKLASYTSFDNARAVIAEMLAAAN